MMPNRFRPARRRFLAAMLAVSALAARAEGDIDQTTVDIPTRPGVTERLLLLAPPSPKAAVVLFAGSHGGLQISADSKLGWGEGNFLIRSRALFAEQGLLVAIVDAPSDRQRAPFLAGFRDSDEHVRDIGGVIAYLRERARVPVWLVGTSRGTQSAAYVATQLSAPQGPDGLVLTSTILVDSKSRAVPRMALERLQIPVLIVHHENDGCKLCPFSDVPVLMQQLSHAARTRLVAMKGGENRGDPCEAWAHHGFNGLERDVVALIAAFILAP